jgi:DNA (cytosine-5)-methyltransferase 1
MLRVIAECKPTWIIGENVAGLINMAQPDSQPEMGCEADIDIEENADCDARGILGGIIDDLEDLGYEVQPFVIPACAVNAPHRRDRVWIVGYAASCAERKKQKICEGQSADSARGVEPDRHAPDTECGEQLWGYENGSILRERETREVNSGDIVDAPDTDLPRSQGRDEHGERAGERSFGPGHTEQWAEDWYTVALRTCVRDLDDGVSGKLAGRHRVSKLKALGNAIVPQVAYEILKTITEINNDRHLNAN